MKAQKIISNEKRFKDSPLFLPYILELCIVAPCPLPFVIGISMRKPLRSIKKNIKI